MADFTFVYGSIADPSRPTLWRTEAADPCAAVEAFEQRYNMHVCAYVFYRKGAHSLAEFHATRAAWVTLKTGGK